MRIRTVRLACLSIIAGIPLVHASPLAAQGTATGNPTIACTSQWLTAIGADVVVMDASGAHQTVVASLPGVRTPAGLCWSPDLDITTDGYQGRIVYGVAGSPWTIWTLRINTSSNGTFSWEPPVQIPLSPPAGNVRFDASSPSWSPDGKWLAMRGTAISGTGTNLGGIWTIPWNTTTLYTPTVPTRCTSGCYSCWNMDPARAGEWIASTVSPDLLVTQVALTDTCQAAGDPVATVTNAFSGTVGSYMSWGNRGIVFAGSIITTKGKTSTTTGAGIYTVEFSAGAPVDLTRLVPIPGTSALGHPCWSSDNQYIFCRSSSGIVKLDPANGTQQLYLSNTKKQQWIAPPACRP